MADEMNMSEQELEKQADALLAAADAAEEHADTEKEAPAAKPSRKAPRKKASKAVRAEENAPAWPWPS